MADSLTPTWDSTSPVGAPTATPTQPQGPAPTWDNTYDPQERYGGAGQQAIAGLEGFGQGLVGPLAPMAEKALGVNPQDIAGRAEANPFTKGAGEVAGLIAPLFVSGGSSAAARAAVASGEAAHDASFLSSIAAHATLPGVMSDVGNLATNAVGLGNLAKDASYATRVGSNIVRQAAETAVMQMSDDASKMVYNDKDAPTSTENAIANVGLAAALGGAAGGVWTGAVSPLWKATVGTKVEEFLKGLKYHLNDEGAIRIKDHSGVSTVGVPELPGAPGAAAKTVPSAEIRNVADEYAKSKNLKLTHDLPILTPDPERGAAIAKAYENMKHAPNDPQVRKAYDALSRETMEQWEAIKKTGLKVEAIPEGMENPYKKSTDMITDVRNNNHMWYYPTSSGFGSKDTLPKFFSVLSAQKGAALDAAAHDALKADLINSKLGKISEVAGQYKGQTEPAFMVEHNGSPQAKVALDALRQKYGQEAVLHSEAGSGGRFNEMNYGGKKPSTTGFGIDQNPTAKDFTNSAEYGKFNLKFDKPTQDLEHPLLSYTPDLINGKPTQTNDIFRIVHDYFGHAKEGFGFGPKGEENAWHHHMQMFSPEAQKAMTSETRGQNSWVNFGPHGEANRMNPANTVYADQKAGVIPAWTRSTKVKPVTTIAKMPLNKEQIKELGKTGADTASNAAMQEIYDQSQDEASPMVQAVRKLGIDLPPVMRAAMNGEPKAIQIFNELRESQHPEIIAALKDLPSKIDSSLSSKLGVQLEDAAHYSENEAGKDVYDTFTKEYNQVYDPVAQALEKRNADAAPIAIRDEARRDFGGEIIERGMNEVGTDSPYYNTYEHYAQRAMAKDTIGQLDKLKTEIYNKAKSVGTDLNEKTALNDVRNMINEFQEKQIAQQGIIIGKDGLTDATDMINSRLAANKGYARFSDMSQTLSDHLNVGDFRGAGTLKTKLGGVSPEDLLKKFSPKGNADAIPFLQQYFPNTLKKVQEVEAKKFIAPSIYKEAGNTALDIPRLNRALEKALKGSPEYAKFVMPGDAQESLQAAQTVLDSIPKIKSSGTAGWIDKLTRHLPASAMSAVGFLSGHNPISGYLIGEMAERLGRDVPNEIKLGYLKMLGADKPVQADSFKAMVDFMHSAYTGEHSVSNAVKNVLKSGAQVLTTSQIPNAQDREKLDKTMTKIQQNPQNMNPNTSLGHYMPDHQAAATMTGTRAMQYLQTLKPQPHNLGPLDKPIPPSKAMVARYNRALDIAQQPNIVLSRIKSGTLQVSDIQDLKAMYPSLYDSMTQKLTNEIATYQGDSASIPYKTRLGISLFLGQPMDSSMQPMSIIAAQASMQTASQTAPQPQGKKPTKEAGKSLGKGAKAYQTPSQSAEADRTKRE